MSNAHERETRTSMSGLTEEEAKSFHRIFVVSFVIYVAVAVGAHVLAWMWKPWGI